MPARTRAIPITSTRPSDRRRFAPRRFILLVALIAIGTLGSCGQVLASGVTNSGDDLRDGWYPDEPSLTPQLVSGGTFGQLWSATVDGQVYAQPLLANGTLLVATENDKVYGLDPATGAMRWPAPLDLGPAWKASDIGCGDLTPNIGVTATPVIDSATNTAYLTHKTYASGTSGPARWYMDAVDITSGKEKAGFPVELSGSAQNQPGMTFQPTTQLQRPGLLLMEGVVYAAFGSHCDLPPWQGWVFGVSTAGQVKARWVSVPSGDGAGIWQSGAGLTSDRPGSLLVSTGNTGAPSAPAPGKSPPASLGESIVRLAVQPDGSLKPVDFFAPFDAQQLDSWDADFASGGVTGLNEQYFGTPATPRLAVAVGKDGYVYLLNRDELGGFMQGPGSSDNVVQRIGPYGGVWSRPGVWPGDGGWVYIPTASGGNSAGGSSGFLRVYQYGVSGSGQPTLSLQATSSDAFGFTSSAPVITSDGTNSGSALVWTVWTPNGSGVGAQLRAYDPVPVGGKPVLRWSAPIGTSAKFAIPGVGAGRLYVGTRDGKVLGFGSPITPILTGPATNFPTTTLGSSAQKTVTLTATNTLTLTKLTSNSTQFTVGSPSLALPAQLSAGQTVQVPLTFTPTQTGLIGATLSAETSQGSTASFALSGTGQAASAQLSTTPTVLSFGGTTVGGHLSGGATFRNVGGAPLTINAVNLPAAPFGATGVPAVGSTIAPGAGVTINITFDPTATGNYSGQISLETTGGNGTVGLSGSAGAVGVLQVSSEHNELGTATVGTTVTKSFTVTNTGGTNVTITKSKPPSGGAFTATTSLPEGTVVLPGESLTDTVAFTPTAPGYAGASWAINGNDSTGLHEVSFTGTGSVPAPGSAWSHNGSATISAGVLRTTPAKANLAGSGFFTTPIDSRHVIVEFDQTISSGTGADGQTLVFADASKTTPAALGVGGGGLGFSGIPGIAVAFDTYKGVGAPSNNFVGITDGPAGAPDQLHWLATAVPAVSLRSTTPRHVKVEVLSGVITTWIDGVQVLSGSASLPPKVLLGFTGGTGGRTDIHQVANVVVGGDASAPAPASLRVGEVVSAPAGSPQAGTQVVVSGSCPSSFTTAALGNGGSATPVLTGAVAGASCSVSQAAPSESGWKTTVSVNGGAEQALTVSGGQLTVPTFALQAGTNTVQFTNTYTSSGGGPGIPDPAAGGWMLNGTASLTASELVLTAATSYQKGSAFWPKAIDPRNITAEFEASSGGGTGADGLALVFGDATRGALPISLGVEGGGLGFSGIPGIAVALDTYKGVGAPSNNFLGVTDGPTSSSTPDVLHWLATANLAVPLENVTHKIKVVTTSTTITAYVDGTQVLSQAVTLPSSAYLGFSGGTGGLNDRHAISHLTVSSEAGGPAPASLRVGEVVSAPAGSPQAGTQVVVSGSCPSSFTTAALGNGGSATPVLTGAVAGASCSVSQAAPSESGWKTTVSVNGGAEQALTVSGGQLTVPTFALQAGTNTVQFTNTYTSSGGGPGIPDPAAGGWMLNGTASLTASELVLTAATSYQKGSAFWPKAIDPRNITAEFEASSGGGTGADGLALVFGDATRGALPISLGVEGGGLGFSGIPGIAVALDTYKGVGAPSNNFLGVTDGPTSSSTPDVLHWLATANLAVPLENVTHKIKVVTTSTTITAYVDGTQVLSQAVTLPSSAYLGFSGGTGGLNDRHAISHLTVS
jgi:hypothetical protein